MQTRARDPLQTGLFPRPRRLRKITSTTAATCAGWQCGKGLSLDSSVNHHEPAWSESPPDYPGGPVRYYCEDCTFALYEGRGTLHLDTLIALVLASLMAIVVTLLH